MKTKRKWVMMLKIIMATMITKQTTISITTITIKGNTIYDDKAADVHDDNEDQDKQTYKPVWVRELTG